MNDQTKLKAMEAWINWKRSAEGEMCRVGLDESVTIGNHAGLNEPLVKAFLAGFEAASPSSAGSDSCAKCAGTNIKTTFVKKDQHLDSSSRSRVENDFVTSTEYDFFYRLNARCDHLFRRCLTCQHGWRESTKDEESNDQV